ncbi:PAS domain S-box protein [Alicyclobacillus acidoterrestris]|uniref:histidine kinase n=1 Tax=Alicyclobacillus acidoterrestris (strain ATCC 49025 / DSM 3922 / CIP 106132 / NCIMB 13137 / GD3B) TaxID=1356854 RepID=T0BUN2_ALIAG|nr:PAS domain S-box protein [Alicyclobacillus acidoterrestris]EPZ44140.1 hypothetical protein N007_11495 [Alicyclobacillus acidoterrestris ATCC 49025]UNO49659.1 PAS domain S-box protein [Alicyclobacillus acidoterrestris]
MSTLVNSTRDIVWQKEILESIYDGYYEMDQSANLVMLNSSLCEILRVPECQLIGKAYRRHLTYSQAKSLYRLWSFVWRTGAPRRAHEFQFTSGDGQELTLEASATLVRNSFGAPVGMRGIIRNITDRKRVECALRESERRYRSLFDENSDLVVQLDLKGRIVDVNPMTEEFIGYDRESLLGLPLQVFLSKQDIYHLLRGFVYSRAGVIKELEVLIRHRTGRPIRVRLKVIPIRADDTVTGVFAICRDVTERHATVEAIRKLSIQTKSILESVAEGICGVDLQGRVIFVNPAAERMSGYAAANLHGRDFYETLGCSGNSHIRERGHRNPVQEAMHSGQTRHIVDVQFWRKDGTPFPVEYVVSPIYEEDQVTGAVLVFRDITLRRQSEEMLLRSEKLSVVGQLAAGIAHEIRNPLTTLKGFLQLVAKQPESGPKYADIMSTEIERISRITNELLAVARPQFSEFQSTPVEQIVTRVYDLFHSEALMQGIVMEMHLQDEGAMVLCEADRIHQVLVNLIKNAMDAVTGGGRVYLSTWVDADKVYIRVRDTGIGMDATTLEHVGEPFYTTKSGGTGLGVMVCQRIVQSHGGCIEWDSKVGEGTTVTMNLPLHMLGNHA